MACWSDSGELEGEPGALRSTLTRCVVAAAEGDAAVSGRVGREDQNPDPPSQAGEAPHGGCRAIPVCRFAAGFPGDAPLALRAWPDRMLLSHGSESHFPARKHTMQAVTRRRLDAWDGRWWPMLAGSLLVLAVVGTPACSDERETRPPAREAFLGLEQEIAIGSEDGRADDSFHGIVDVVTFPDGGFWVLDGRVFGSDPMIRRFGEDGGFLGPVGGIGDGPGEFRGPYAMAALGDGRVVVRDHEVPNRLSVYAADGSSEADWRLPVAVQAIAGAYQNLLVDPDDTVWMKVVTGRPTDQDRRLGWVRVASGGVLLDTIFPPEGADRLPPLRSSGTGTSAGPAPTVVLSPNRYFAVAHRSALSVSMIPIRSSGSVTRELPSPDGGPGDEGQAGVSPRRTLSISGPMRGLAVGDEGRLWVRVESDLQAEALPDAADPGPGHWEVFEPDGTRIGNVRLPDVCTVFRSRADRVWCVTRDDLGTERISRLRIAR
jgi:hypothetical protein